MTLPGMPPAAGGEDVCIEVERLLLAGEHVVLVLERCDLGVVDALARLRLLAERLGGSLAVVGDRELLRLCGLEDVL